MGLRSVFHEQRGWCPGGSTSPNPSAPENPGPQPDTLKYLQNVSHPVKPEVVELIGKEHTLRVLFALRGEGPLRFGELESRLAVNPAQLDRALSWLQDRVYVLAETIPAPRGPIRVRYEISKRGRAFLKAFDSFLAEAEEQRGILGEKTVRDLEALAG